MSACLEANADIQHTAVHSEIAEARLCICQIDSTGLLRLSVEADDGIVVQAVQNVILCITRQIDFEAVRKDQPDVTPE